MIRLHNRCLCIRHRAFLYTGAPKSTNSTLCNVAQESKQFEEKYENTHVEEISSLAPPSCSTDLRALCESPRAQNPLVGALHPPPDTNPPIIRDQKYRTKNAECESQKPKTHFWCLLLPNHFFNDGSKFPFQP